MFSTEGMSFLAWPAAKSIPGFKKFEDVWDDRAPLGYELGANSYVQKPIDAKKYERDLKALIAGGARTITFAPEGGSPQVILLTGGASRMKRDQAPSATQWRSYACSSVSRSSQSRAS